MQSGISYVKPSALVQPESLAEHLDVDEAEVGHSVVASSSLVLVLDVEVTGIALHAVAELAERVFTDAVEMQELAVVRGIVRITDHRAATIFCKARGKMEREPS